MADLGAFGAAKREADPGREPDTFTFFGERFTVVDEVGTMPLLEFAAAAEAGFDSESMAGLAAMYNMIRDCLPADEWARFRQVAVLRKADGETLMAVCAAIYTAVSGRPTGRPSDSPGGPSQTSSDSNAPSPGRYPESWGRLVPVDDLPAALTG